MIDLFSWTFWQSIWQEGALFIDQEIAMVMGWCVFQVKTVETGGSAEQSRAALRFAAFKWQSASFESTTDVHGFERWLLCILSHWPFSTGEEAKRVQTSVHRHLHFLENDTSCTPTDLTWQREHKYRSAITSALHTWICWHTKLAVTERIGAVTAEKKKKVFGG